MHSQHKLYSQTLRDQNSVPGASSKPTHGLLHSRWGGRHPAQIPVKTGSFPVSSEEHHNFFDEFKEKVLQIRDAELAAQGAGALNGPTNQNDLGTAAGTNQIRATSTVYPETVNESGSGNTQHNHISETANNELVERLKTQNLRIEELELLVRQLRTEQSETIMRHKIEIADIKAQAKDERAHGKRSHFPLVQEAEFNELRQKNAKLQQCNREMAKRAKILVSMHQHRMSLLEAKLQSSLSINQYYLNNGNSSCEYSTMQLLHGYEDNTTALLLQPPKQNNTARKSSLRVYILAVIFTIRARNQVQCERAWKMNLLD